MLSRSLSEVINALLELARLATVITKWESHSKLPYLLNGAYLVNLLPQAFQPQIY